MSISTQEAFDGLGIDAVTGVELMDWLGLTPIDFGDPGRFSRMRDVIDYMKKFPPDTQRFLIARVTKNRMVDRLNQVWEYSQLLSRRERLQDELNTVEKERAALGTTPDPFIQASVDKRSLETRENIAKINNEIDIYEK